MSKRLKANAVAIKNVRGEPGKRVVYSIDGITGLRLYIEPTGRRTWYYEYKVAGRRNRMHIGDASVVSLSDARSHAMDMRRDVELGEDPKQREIEQKLAAKREAFTFRHLFEKWLAAHQHLKGLKERVRTLEADVLPMLEDCPVDEVSKRDVIDVIDTIADRGARIHADHVAAYLSALFNWGMDEELCEINPAHRIRKRGNAKPRERVLNDDELVRVWNALDAGREGSGIAEVTCATLKLALLTGQRRGEIVAARCVDFNLDSAVWTIPAERTKNGKTHVVPLSDLALDIAGSQLVENAGAEFIFPAATVTADSPHLHPRSASKALEKLCRSQEIEGVSMHCFRRTLATRLGDMGVTGDVISRILNHAPRDVTSRHYNHARMMSQMREALEQWEAHILERIDMADAA